MSAKDFGDVLRSHPNFHTRLTELVDKIGRKDLRLLGEKSDKLGLSWTLKSAVAAAMVGIAACLGTWAIELEAYFYFLVNRGNKNCANAASLTESSVNSIAQMADLPTEGVILIDKVFSDVRQEN